MSRIEFMSELEKLLLDVPLEERLEALKFYEDFFEDGGPDKEEEILKELGTPEKVAKAIQLDLSGNPAGILEEEKKSGEQIELYQGAAQKAEEEEKEPVDGSRKNQEKIKEKDWREEKESQEGTGQWEEYKYEKNRRQSRIIWIILLCIFGFPVIFPLMIAGLVMVIAVTAVIFGLFLGFFIPGIALTAAGVMVFLLGLGRLLVFPPDGLVMIGSGLILFGTGFVMAVFSIWLFIKVLPAFMKWVAEVIGRIFGGKRRETV